MTTVCLELNWLFYNPNWIMQQLSEFVWTLRSSTWVAFNNFLLIDSTDRSKINSDLKHLFFAVSLYPLSFFVNTPFNRADISKSKWEHEWLWIFPNIDCAFSIKSLVYWNHLFDEIVCTVKLFDCNQGRIQEFVYGDLFIFYIPFKTYFFYVTRGPRYAFVFTDYFCIVCSCMVSKKLVHNFIFNCSWTIKFVN